MSLSPWRHSLFPILWFPTSGLCTCCASTWTHFPLAVLAPAFSLSCTAWLKCGIPGFPDGPLQSQPLQHQSLSNTLSILPTLGILGTMHMFIGMGFSISLPLIGTMVLHKGTIIRLPLPWIPSTQVMLRSSQPFNEQRDARLTKDPRLNPLVASPWSSIFQENNGPYHNWW